ncbi:MAG: trypsin-like peptidase domain-containing protein [Planctomycetaceae bacterium]|nr:trypsin-like peptidase domain-containing protein [Planctomycetaceae bacterium]
MHKYMLAVIGSVHHPIRKMSNSSEKQDCSVPLSARIMFLAGFTLIIATTVTFTPEIAKQIAYSWNIGVERARAEVARQFLEEHPFPEQRMAMVVRAVAPSVVGVHVIAPRRSEGYNPTRNGPAVLTGNVGSGVIVNAQEGHILTNYHVISDAHLILVQLSDGRETEAEVIGRDRTLDLAVLRIVADDLEAIAWGDSRQVLVGEQVVAIGSPYGLQQTVTSGIISATERSNPVIASRGTRRGTRSISREFLQTDAAINPGNSGGPLVDMNGQLIGICTAIIALETGGNSGIGFAIPSFTAERIYEEILVQGEVRHSWIGIMLSDITLSQARELNLERPMGTLVEGFADINSPARDAGLQRGDIVVRWGDTVINDTRHFTHLIAITRPGTTKEIEIIRDGETLTLEITTAARPANW